MTAGSGVHRLLVTALLVGGMLFVSCGGQGSQAYQDGYAAGYADGHADGIRRGEIRGAADGSPEGRASAAGRRRDDITTHPYFAPALWSFLAGVAIGLICQYLILFASRDQGRVPSLVQTGLVPGMTSTFSYRLLERRWRLMARLDDWLERVAGQRNARIHEIRAVRAVMAARINAASDLEDLVGRKYVQLASRELDRIVREAENGR